jgi:hypothetical protein
MKRKVIYTLVLALFLLGGCTAVLQQAWNSKTPDEQARIIVSGLQKTLDQKFVEAKALVDTNPTKYGNLWKKNIVPAFDKANKTLKVIATLAQQSKIDPAQVYIQYKPDIDALMLYLIQLGMKGDK